MRIELVKEKKWFFRLVATNHQTVMTSETYYSRWNAKRQALKIAKANGFEFYDLSREVDA